MFHHRGCQRESAFASELMMDKEFFHSFEHGSIQNTAIFLHLEDTFSIWVNLFMGK